ncbi:NERD domain-containing protein [Moritella viscosa]|nr:NERD domain-containing protein [Moritella viscosa]SHO14540.1 NERD and DEXDc domain protein [Moritella viscosa]SHO15456.1 NERD and DEXDc domain protein [Moritella viscosa]SHO19228.1 NERD and DEXDc domain protein [Moritella viscosa]
MANMIPRILVPSIPSDGEKHLFSKLENDSGASNWTVLHSLNIAYHKTQVMGEIDFYVIIPNLCVFAIEVKAHHFVKFEHGLWHLGKNGKAEFRGPFQQTNDAVFSLVEYFKNKSTHLRNIPIFPLVIFTHTELQQSSIEWHLREFCSAREYRRIPISKLLLNRARSYRIELARTKTTKWFSSNDNRPNDNDIKLILKIVRPKIEHLPISTSFRKSLEQDMEFFTREQFIALDAMADNQRVIYKGPAGVGKTVLAMEVALRAAKQDHKVLFLCKNKLLTHYLQKHTQHPNIDILSITQLLEAQVGKSFINKQDRGKNIYWNINLPQDAYKNLIDKNSEYTFLVMDEAQDILINKDWVDCIELLLRGGIASGKWNIFGEFELQNLYSIFKHEDLLRDLKYRTNEVTSFNLTLNCRNLKEVSSLNFSLSGLTNPYSKYLRTNKPISASKYYFYSSEKDLLKKLREQINTLLNSGFKPNDILSKVSESKSIANRYLNDLSTTAFSFSESEVQFTSIHKFKGLEAPIIILADFDEIETNTSKNLLYIGASRATESVIYLFNAQIKSYTLKC